MQGNEKYIDMDNKHIAWNTYMAISLYDGSYQYGIAIDYRPNSDNSLLYKERDRWLNGLRIE